MSSHKAGNTDWKMLLKQVQLRLLLLPLVIK